MADDSSTLRVAVSTALGAVPVADAVVTVSTDIALGDPQLLYHLKTDAGGLTPAVTLATPPRQLSLTPGGARPFAVYTVEVDHPDFTPIAALRVALFPGIPAVLPVTLTPLPENAALAPQIFTADAPPQTLYEEAQP